MNTNIDDVDIVNKTACFIGCSSDISSSELNTILDVEIGICHFDIYNKCIVGMSCVHDLIVAEYVLKKKEEYPEIKLICAVPYVGIEEKLDKAEKERFENIIKQADSVKYISESYTPECFEKLNMWLVDHSRMVLSAYYIYHGGIRNSLKYAVKQRRIIKNMGICLFLEYDC